MAGDFDDPLAPPPHKPGLKWRKDRLFAVGAIAAIVVVVTVILASLGGDAETTVPLPSPEGVATVLAGGGQIPAGQPTAAATRPPRPDPLADLDPALQQIMRWGMPVYCGAGTKPLVALTFDDGPGVLTQETIDNLRERNAGATFFLVGKFMKDPGAIATAADEATTYDIGDHSQNHFGLAGASASTLRTEVSKPKRLIESAIDRPVIYFRPPWGSRDHALEDYVAREDMIMVVWSLDSTDSATGTNTDDIVKVVEKYVGPGDIVLLHENRGTTRNAFPQILDVLQEKGLTPVTLTELLTQDPPTKKQLKTGQCP